MSLYDRLVPAEALRFDRIHPMTRPWLELDAWLRANPALGDRIDALALWDSLPPHVHFMRTGEFVAGGLIPKPEPVQLHEGERVIPSSWIPWRKRR